MCSTKPVNFFAAQFGTSGFGPMINGTVGLGLGQPMYGASFTTQLAAQVGSPVSNVWSFSAGPYVKNVSTLFVGGINNNIVKVNSTWAWFNTTGNSWTINQADVRLNGSSIFNATETAKAYFNFQVDNILLPNATYAKVVANMTKALPTLNCSGPAGSSCVVNDVCGNVAPKLLPIQFSFDGVNYYSLPITVEAVDQQNAITCQVKIGRQSKGNFVTLGLPFMKAFYTAYDMTQAKVGITIPMGSLGTVGKV